MSMSSMSLLTKKLLLGSSRGVWEGLSSRSAISMRNLNQLSPRFTHLSASAIMSTLQLPKPSSVTVPARPSSSSSSHVALWSAEKAFSAALLPIIPVAFFCPSTTMDYLLAFTITLHSHWGIEAIVVDYVRPSIFGELVPKIAVAMVFAFSALLLGGLCYFTYTDVGLVQAIKMLWKL